MSQPPLHTAKMMEEPRIVSLIASATEIVAALGFEEQLVGRSHECDFPAFVEDLPVCSSSKVDAGALSLQIDTQVRAIVAEALSVYRVDAGLLDRLAPTHIVTQTQCEVCAVSLADVERAVCELVASQPRIVSLAPMSLADVWQDIQTVATALGADERGVGLVGALTTRLDAIRTRARMLPRRPSIACVEWIEPLMHAENWLPELVDIAGGTVMLGEAGRHSGYFPIEELVERNPDIIAIMPCGFDIERSLQEMPALTSRAEWPGLSAVTSGRVFVTDGNQYFNRPGPRVVESAEILAELLHPDVFDFGHRGTGWVPWEAAPA